MRVPRLYLPQALSAGQTLTLPTDRGHYLTRVLRLQPGNKLILFNGDGGQYQATLANSGARDCRVEVGAFSDKGCESPLPVTLIQGISRGERMELTLRKATELGVCRIQPVTSRRCQVKLDGTRLEKRVQHWQAILASACEQSGRNRLPELLPPTDLARSLAEMATQPADRSGTLALTLDPQAQSSLTDFTGPVPAVSLLIGPEGGLSPEEIEQAARSGFRGVRLGPRVLRTETAPLAALAAIQVLWGDMG